MAKISIREAVTLYRVSRPTLSKHLKDGTVSGDKDGQGRWAIDTSELARVYKPRAGELENQPDKPGVPLSGLPSALSERVAALEAELGRERERREHAEALAEERARHLEDLRRLLPRKETKSLWRRLFDI